MKTPPKTKPTRAAANWHTSVTITERQAARLRSGRAESKPSDYADLAVSAERRRLADVRRALEDRQMMRDLGLLDS